MSARATSSRANATSPPTLSLDAHRNRKSAPSSPAASGASHSTTRRSGSPVGVLDLHHVGAAVGQQLGAVRARQPARQVDDLHAGEGPGDAHPATVGQHTPGGEPPPFPAPRIGGWLGRAGAAAPMTAAWMWARAELRARWKAWLLLGVLAGVTVGVAAAGWAGARRTERAVPDAVAAARIPTAALLANDPAFGPEQRARGGEAPRRHRGLPVPGRLLHPGLQPAAARRRQPVVVPGRSRRRSRSSPGPWSRVGSPIRRRADEIVVDENTRDRFGLDLGATMVLGQEVQPRRGDPAAVPARRRRHELPPAHARGRHRQVGVERPRAGRRRAASTRSTARTCRQLVNEFVDLRDGRAGIAAFNRAGQSDPRPPGERRGHLRPLRHPQGAERHRPRARRVCSCSRSPRSSAAACSWVRRSCGRCPPAPPTCRPGARSAPTAARHARARASRRRHRGRRGA